MKTHIIEGEKHFAVSVWLITKSRPKKVLLVNHKKLNKWLQPGGHIEAMENPVEAAIREIKEETGLDISQLRQRNETVYSDTLSLVKPTFLLQETYPAYRNQPQHFHLDLQYILEIEEQPLVHDPNESNGIGWFTQEEALKLPMYENTKVLINKII